MAYCGVLVTKDAPVAASNSATSVGGCRCCESVFFTYPRFRFHTARLDPGFLLQEQQKAGKELRSSE